MNEFTLPIRNLLGQPTRSALTTLGVAVAVAGLIALTGLTQGLQNSYDRGIEETGADFIVSQRDAFSIFSSSVPASLGSILPKVDGVEAVSGTLLNFTSIDNDANIVIAGWPIGSYLWRNLRLLDGQIPEVTDPPGVVLGESIARALKKHVGDDVELQFKQHKIVGIASFGTSLNQNIAIVLLPSLQELLGRVGTVTLYQVKLARPLDAKRVASVGARLISAADGFAVNNTAEFVSNIRFFHIIQEFASAISIIVFGMALLAVANTLLMAVNERTYELGILGAIGWSPARIIRLILLESIMMSAIGGAVGVGLGIVAMNFVAKTNIAAGVLEPYVTLSIVTQALIAVMLIGPLGAFYPAWRAIRLKPAEALRAH